MLVSANWWLIAVVIAVLVVLPVLVVVLVVVVRFVDVVEAAVATATASSRSSSSRRPCLWPWPSMVTPSCDGTEANNCSSGTWEHPTNYVWMDMYWYDHWFWKKSESTWSWYSNSLILFLSIFTYSLYIYIYAHAYNTPTLEKDGSPCVQSGVQFGRTWGRDRDPPLLRFEYALWIRWEKAVPDLPAPFFWEFQWRSLQPFFRWFVDSGRHVWFWIFTVLTIPIQYKLQVGSRNDVQCVADQMPKIIYVNGVQQEMMGMQSIHLGQAQNLQKWVGPTQKRIHPKGVLPKNIKQVRGWCWDSSRSWQSVHLLTLRIKRLSEVLSHQPASISQPFPTFPNHLSPTQAVRLPCFPHFSHHSPALKDRSPVLFGSQSFVQGRSALRAALDKHGKNRRLTSNLLRL